MPEAPKRPCSGGCGAAVESGRCDKCRPASGRPSFRRGDNADIYGGKWPKASRGFLAAHPECANPEKRSDHKDVFVASEETDHIVPHRGDRKLFWNPANWQPLCKACHSRKTARENDFGRY